MPTAAMPTAHNAFRHDRLKRLIRAKIADCHCNRKVAQSFRGGGLFCQFLLWGYDIVLAGKEIGIANELLKQWERCRRASQLEFAERALKPVAARLAVIAPNDEFCK